MRATIAACLLMLPACSTGTGGAGRATDWSHKELLDHLNRSGGGWRTATAKGGNAVYLYTNPELDGAGEAGASYQGGGSAVLCRLLASEKDAREKAGTLGDKGFAWGRFVFQGQPKELDRVRAALR